MFEQRISVLMRDYDSLRAHYASLNDKKLSADMSNNLENRQKGERFVILDPAQVADRPTAPNRPLLMIAALLGGLIGGCALALLRDLSDASVRSEREAAKILGKPILADIPAITNPKERRSKAVRATGALIGTAVASVALGIALSYITGRLL